MPIPRDERSTQETSTVPTSVPRSGACHLLTFDVEHWYEGYRLRGRGGWEAFPPRDPDTVHRLLGLLAEHDQHATFFATGRFAAEFPDVVKAIVADGHEVASHSFDHIPIHRIGGPPAFRDDLHRSVSLLRELTGQPVLGFRAPCWAIADASYRWVLDALADEGLRYDSSRFVWGLPLGARATAPRMPHRLALGAGGSLWEVPPSVLSIGPVRLPAAGGFYLRFFPEAAIGAALHQAAAAGRPGLLYLHPYDMDPGAPRLPAPWYFTLMRYHRLGRTEGILRRLLRSHRFMSIREWLADR